MYVHGNATVPKFFVFYREHANLYSNFGKISI